MCAEMKRKQTQSAGNGEWGDRDSELCSQRRSVHEVAMLGGHRVGGESHHHLVLAPTIMANTPGPAHMALSLLRQLAWVWSGRS